MYGDEPVLFRTGPHWMSEDFTMGLGFLLVVYAIVAPMVDPQLLAYAAIPAAPLLIRIAVELPRFWRFETVLTSRRLVINVGTLRDVYHTLRVADMVGARLEQRWLGKLLGYGSVAIAMRGEDATGRPKTGTITLDHVRQPEGLAKAISSAVEAMATEDRTAR